MHLLIYNKDFDYVYINNVDLEKSYLFILHLRQTGLNTMYLIFNYITLTPKLDCTLQTLESCLCYWQNHKIKIINRTQCVLIFINYNCKFLQGKASLIVSIIQSSQLL